MVVVVLIVVVDVVVVVVVAVVAVVGVSKIRSNGDSDFHTIVLVKTYNCSHKH